MEDKVNRLETRVKELENIVRDIENRVLTKYMPKNELDATLNDVQRNSVKLTKEIAKNLQKMKEYVKTEVIEKTNNNMTALEESVQKLETKLSDQYQTKSELEQSLNRLQEDSVETTTELTKTIQATNKHIDKEIQQLSQSTNDKMEHLRESVNNEISDFKSTLEQYSTTSSDQIKALEQRISELSERTKSQIGTVTQKTNQNLEFISETQTLLSDLNSSFENYKEKTDQNLSTLKSEFEQQLIQKTGKLEKTLQDTRDQFADTVNSQTKAVLSMDELIKETQNANEEVYTDLKNDQQRIFNSFQRMLSGLAESLRNENIIIAKEVRESLEKAEDEIAEGYMKKRDQKVLEDRITNLDKDLRSKSENIRQDLVNSLEKAIKNFDEQAKESIEQVEDYRKELEQYKDELQAMIERKVNAKYDFIFGIIGDMVTKTEQLAKNIQESRVRDLQIISKMNKTQLDESNETQLDESNETQLDEKGE